MRFLIDVVEKIVFRKRRIGHQRSEYIELTLNWLELSW